jgi:hypothetical protein
VGGFHPQYFSFGFCQFLQPISTELSLSWVIHMTCEVRLLPGFFNKIWDWIAAAFGLAMTGI